MIQVAKCLTYLLSKILFKLWLCHDNSCTKKRKVTTEEDSMRILAIASLVAS